MTLPDGGKPRKIKEVASHDSMFEEDQEGRCYPAQGSKTKAGDTGKEIFQGRELGDIDSKELKRIQIDIKRSIPSHRVSNSPIRRRVVNPKTVVLSRRKGSNMSDINSWKTISMNHLMNTTQCWNMINIKKVFQRFFAARGQTSHLRPR